MELDCSNYKKVREEPKNRRFIVELLDRDVNTILLLYVKIKSKSSDFGIRGSSGEERGAFWWLALSPMVGW